MAALVKAVRRGGVAALLALALALPACSAGAGPAPSATPGSGSGAAGALDFSAPTVDGDRFDTSPLAGTSVVLWFWAPF